MNRWLKSSLPFLLGTAVVSAQVQTGGGQESDRVTRRAQEMRQNIDDGTGRQVKSHVRVEVRLKNGNRLKGVVKDGRFVERVDGLRFVDASAADKGAGIRLWYSGGTRNYVFVPFAEFETYRVLQRLNAQELAEIETELQMEETQRIAALRQQALERAAAEAEAKPAKPPGETGDPASTDPKTDPKDAAKEGQSGDAAKDAKEAQTLVWFKLLQDYPPAEGWNADKRGEIQRRFQVIGAKPSEKEQRFVDQFAEWELGCKHFRVDVGQKSDADADSGRTGKKSKK